MEGEFRNIDLCIKNIRDLDSRISNLKGKLRVIEAVVNKQTYIQETITFSIGGQTTVLSVATQSGTHVKSGADMVLLGIKKILNVQLTELEFKVSSSKNTLVINANKLLG